MIKKLTKYGNSQALIIDKPILKLIGINENDSLKITTDGKSLIITPLLATKQISSKKLSKKGTVQKAFDESVEQYDKTMRKLARYRKP